MGLYQLYEKLGGVSPGPLLNKRRPRRTRSNTSLTEVRSVPHEVACNLDDRFTDLRNAIETLVERIAANTNQRVTAQRLCYDMGSSKYDVYNNEQTRAEISRIRSQVQNWIQDIQKQLLGLDKYLADALPPVGRRQHRSTYEMGRTQYLRGLRSLLTEFLEITVQLKRDLKDLCNEYCEYISEKYYTGKYLRRLTTGRVQ